MLSGLSVQPFDATQKELKDSGSFSPRTLWSSLDATQKELKGIDVLPGGMGEDKASDATQKELKAIQKS